MNNTILRLIYSALNVDESVMKKIFLLGKFEVKDETLHGYLQEVGDKDFRDCGYEALGSFLDGLIIYKRGESRQKTSSDEVVSLTNNLILKKLRVAFELKDADLYFIFESVGLKLNKSELSGLFRKENHKNFRKCSDELLLKFLEALVACEKNEENL